MKKTSLILLFVMAGFLWTCVCTAGSTKVRPQVLPVNKPERITSETDPVLDAAVSRDGKWLVYTSGRQNSTDLWLRSADPAVVVLPKRLTFDTSRKSWPTFSPNGRMIAYTGTANDVKGDIYLLDLESKQARPIRLTGRETEDGGPCFSADGNTLYFHQAGPDVPFRQLAALNLNAKDRSVVRLNIGEDGACPSVSPDGSRLAFVTYRDDPGGDIHVLNLKSKKVVPLTTGLYMDWRPQWSPDSRYIYFARIAVDTDKDGKLTKNDTPSIYRVNIDDKNLRPYPMTPYTFAAFQPQVAGEKLFFLSDSGGVNNCWSTPIEGVIPVKDSPEEQTRLAEKLSQKTPPNPQLALLAYYKVLEAYENARTYAAGAAFEIGKIYKDLQMPVAAADAFTLIGQGYGDVQPQAALALIELVVLQTKARLTFEVNASRRLQLLAQGMGELETIAGSKDPKIKVRAQIERARLLLTNGRDPDALLKAVDLLDAVIDNTSSERVSAAEAMILKADIYAKIGMPDQVYPVYMAVIKTYPDVGIWADEAVKRILNLTVESIEDKTLEEKVAFLRSIAENNRRQIPILSIGALNRVADLLYSAGEWSRAKSIYYQILDQFRVLNIQTSAARLALAEILYKEERFRAALDLYETEIDLRPYEDRISNLARTGYIRKSIASGEYLYRLGEIPSARKIFKELIDYDDAVVAAHRGYIKCAAALNAVQPVLDKYRQRLAQNPVDAVAMYAAGLCLTYLDDKKSLQEAKRLISRAIAIDGRIEYFHQTLGYVFEVLETVYHQAGMLEMALESYKKAYFLNDRQNNPANAANLSLNLANTYFLLGQHAKAFLYYTRRLAADLPFENENTAILFFRRLGTAAFKSRETQKAIDAFTRSLELIDRHMQPQQASDVLDRINRYVMDRIVAAGMRHAGLSSEIKDIAARQSDINRRLSKLNYGRVLPPPAPDWKPYRRGIEALLSEQQKVNHQIILLLEKHGIEGLSAKEVRDTLSGLGLKVKQALKFPERLVELKAEMLDRLGLAYQEAGYPQKAAKTFEQTFSLNKNLVDQGLGSKENLARNKRAAAYNAYLFAGTLSGSQRRKMLQATAKDFVEVVDLVETFGVPGRKKQREAGLVTIRAQVAADEINASQAGYGFSAPQEIRLAQAFLTRIHLELNELSPAEKTIKDQLAEYPVNAPVSDKDVFGVALLYHRAGHLAAAQGKLAAAVEYFGYSAKLSLGMHNPVSTAINVTNMAGLLAGMSADMPGVIQFRNHLEILDTQTTQLLAQNPFAAGKPVAAGYHNKMGVYFKTISGPPAGDRETAVLRTRTLQKAAIHFISGLKMLDQQPYDQDRGKLALSCALHLNMAKTALDFDERNKAADHFESALKLSRHGQLPEFEWRALAGLGRLNEALEALDTVTILRAGCSSGEITTTFGKLVVDLVKAGRVEQAFDLVERLSEIERFNRLAPVVSDLQVKGNDPLSRAVFKSIYPNIRRVQKLRGEISRTEGEQQQYLIEELSREQKLLDAKLGPHKQVLPDTIRFLQDQKTRETTLILLGLAVHAEETAALLVKTVDKERSTKLLNTYNDLVDQYRQTRIQAVLARDAQSSADILAFFGPQPYTAVDVSEHLPEQGRLVRLFAAGDKAPGWIVFTITPHSIDAFQAASITNAFKRAMPAAKGFGYIGYENIPGIIKDVPKDMSVAFTLSGSHLVRSIKNRKPFKRSLLAVGAVDKDIDEYDVKVLKRLSDREISNIAAETNVLFIADDVSLAASVPTKEGEYATHFLAVKSPAPDEDDQMQPRDQAAKKNKDSRFQTDDYSIPVQRLLAKASNLSLALLSGASIKDAYLIGHIFSIYGCSGVIVPEKPVSGSQFAYRFLKAFATTSAQKAVQTAAPPTAGRQRWLQIGFKGMTSAETQAFCDQYFTRYVVEGQQAYENDNPNRALAMFENAIQIARDAEQFSQYLPALYNLGRDSAVLGGRQDKAVEYGRAVVKIMAQAYPGSEQHARTLLMLGSVYAQFEQYEKAVPHIEQAVAILADLKLAPDQIEALAGLSVVLANATQYNSALSHLQSAISITKKLDQTALLARHYTSIGGIYDRGLNQYAMAVKNYNKALAIYRQTEKIADTARMLLSIGRCYRLLGNFIEAESFYQQAFKLIASDAENIRLKAQIIFEQANLAWFRAQYETAFKLQRTCYTLARKHNWPLLQALSLNTSGLIWWTLGNNQKALGELEKALSLGRERMIPDDEIANIIHNTGLVYRAMERYPDALDAFERAIAIDTRLKSRWALAYDLRNQALTYLKTGQIDKAIPLFESAAAEAHSIGNRVNETKALLGLADALFAAGRNKDAEKVYHKALNLSTSMALKETRWRVFYGLARLRLAENNKPDALKLLYAAVEIIENVRAEIKIDLLKESFIDNKLAVYETLVRVLADMGNITESFAMAERSRARNFVDLLGNQRLSLGQTISQQLYDRQIFIKSKIREHEALLAQTNEPADRKVYAAALKKLNNDYSDLMLDIQAQNPQLSAMVSVMPIKADKLMAVLEKDVALLAYYVLPDEILCWVIRPRGITLFRTPMGRDTLGRAILEYRRMIQNIEPLEKQSRELFERLVAPVIGGLEGVKTLGIIPHGSLHYLSFATLSDASSYLIDQYALFYLPSASVLDYTLSKRTHEKNLSVLAIGNPDLGDPLLELPFAEYEVDSIQWNFPNITILTKDKATENWVVNNIEKFGIIHMASHGEFNPVNPLFSSIKLSKGKDTDGNLEAAEIFGLKINADVVVLSACQTGLGKVTDGDDVIGLNRAFFYAGTHTIVSSLWRVSDVSTAVLIKEFYRRYVRHNKADSLRAAILHVKQRNPHPSYWGAFTLVGDYH